MVTFSGGMDIISRSLCREYLFTKEAPQVSFRLNHIRNRCRVVNLLPLLFLILWMMGSVSSHGAPDQVTLQLKWKHQFQFSGYYAAIEQGFYRDAGLEVTFNVTLKEIKEEILPALDDEFAKDMGEYESLDALRAAVREHLESSYEAQSKRDLRTKVIDKLIEQSDFELPEGLVAEELAGISKDAESLMAHRGVPIDHAALRAFRKISAAGRKEGKRVFAYRKSD